jgi:hypothetical protein
MTFKKLSNKKLAFIVTLLYISVATIFIYLVKDIDTGFNRLLFILFLPATVFPELILFTEREPWNMIFICQLITLFTLWPAFWLIIHLLRDDNKQQKIEE